MTWRIPAVTFLGVAMACGSSFEGGGDAGGGGSSNAGRSGGSSTAGKGSGGNTGSSGSGTTGSAGDGDGSGGDGVIGSGGDGVIGSGGDGVIGSGGDGVIGSAGGGVIGSGGATARTCEELMSDYLSELDEARTCNPNVTEPQQCNHDWVMEGPCGCPTPFNSLSPNIELLDQLRQQMEEQGCQFATCEIPCMVPVGSCLAAGERYTCQ